MIDKKYYVYIATNYPRKTVLYTGVTNSLIKREGQHRLKIYSNSFSAKYNINRVVYAEIYGDVNMAIEREKQIKAGSRKNKISLINNANLDWKDLVKLIISNDLEIDDIMKKVEENIDRGNKTGLPRRRYAPPRNDTISISQ